MRGAGTAAIGLLCAAAVLGGACSLILPSVDDLAGQSGGNSGTGATQAGGGASGAASGGGAGIDAGDGASALGPIIPCDAGCFGQYPVQVPKNLPNLVDTSTCDDFEAPCLAWCGTKTTTNVARCRFLWSNGLPQRFYGCCEVSDQSLIINAEAGATGKYFSSDEIEYYLSLNLGCDTNTTKTGLAIGAEGSRVSMHFPDASACISPYGQVFPKIQDSLKVYVAKFGTPNDSFPDQGYRIKWMHEMPFTVPDGGASYFCDFLLGDIDTLGKPQTYLTAFTSGDFNTPSGAVTWGKCVFSP